MRRSPPRVSIGLPVYNGERYLAETLDALLAQTYQDYEILICDNASTDRTGEIALRYQAADCRICYFRSAVNVGLVRNYRRALHLARAPYFRWQAADDLVTPGVLAACVDVLDQRPDVVLVYPRTRLIDASGRVTADYRDNLHMMSERPSERLAQVCERLALCNTIFGLTRTAALRTARPLGTYADSDEVLQAELALYGKFWELEGHYLLRRFHADALSSRSAHARAETFDPNRRPRPLMRETRHLWELALGVHRAPLSVLERFRAIAYLARQARWSRDKLVREVWELIRFEISASRRPATARGRVSS